MIPTLIVVLRQNHNQNYAAIGQYLLFNKPE